MQAGAARSVWLASICRAVLQAITELLTIRRPDGVALQAITELLTIRRPDGVALQAITELQTIRRPDGGARSARTIAGVNPRREAA